MGMTTKNHQNMIDYQAIRYRQAQIWPASACNISFLKAALG